MYTIIPFLIIIVCALAMLIIVIRKFPSLSLLDVSTIPESKEEKKKAEYIKKKMEKKKEENKSKRSSLAPLKEKFSLLQLRFRRYVGKIERKALHQESDQKVLTKDNLRDVLERAKKYLEEKNYELAEGVFLDAVRIDPKNIEAYKGLAEVYLKQGLPLEAKETYAFILQIEPRNDQAMVALGDIYFDEKEYEKAMLYYEEAVLHNDIYASRFAKIAEVLVKVDQLETAHEAARQALQIDPKNPKYLDILLEISIMVGSKEECKALYEQIRMINPDNKKLDIWKTKIKEMKEV